MPKIFCALYHRIGKEERKKRRKARRKQMKKLKKAKMMEVCTFSIIKFYNCIRLT